MYDDPKYYFGVVLTKISLLVLTLELNTVLFIQTHAKGKLLYIKQ